MPFRCLGLERSAWAAPPEHASQRVGDALLAALDADLHVRVRVVVASHEPVQPQPACPCLSHPRNVRPLAHRGKRLSAPRSELCDIPSTWQRPTARRPGCSPRRYRRRTMFSSASGAPRGSPRGGRGDATPSGPPDPPPSCPARSSPWPARPARAFTRRNAYVRRHLPNGQLAVQAAVAPEPPNAALLGHVRIRAAIIRVFVEVLVVTRAVHLPQRAGRRPQLRRRPAAGPRHRLPRIARRWYRRRG